MKNFRRCLPLLLLLSCSAWAVHMERDETGRSVAVPDHAHRVISLAPSITNTIYALGGQSDLVGITDYTVYPPQAAREKPSVGKVVNPSLEHIIALHPDLVLALPEFNGAETIAGLERLGIPVFLFSTGDHRQHLSQRRERGTGHGPRTGSVRPDRPTRAPAKPKSVRKRKASPALRCCWCSRSIR